MDSLPCLIQQAQQLESLRQDAESFETTALQLADYIDRGRPAPAELTQAMEERAAAEQQAARLKQELQALIAHLRRASPAALLLWVRAHAAACARFLAPPTPADPDSSLRLYVARETALAWKSVLEGADEYVAVRSPYLEGYQVDFAAAYPYPPLDVRQLYDRFDAPMVPLDCGLLCAPHNPSGKPFCCDICHAIPAAYHQEWDYLRQSTDLWQPWRGDECLQEAQGVEALFASTPEHMRLLVCKGPAHCQRQFRALSCRQFPFFPYITSGGRFIGLSYDWACESTCWVLSHLDQVTPAYREQFIRLYDELFALWEPDFESYAAYSAQMRAQFAAQRRRIPLLHRNGKDYLLSPRSERLQRRDAGFAGL